MSMSLKYKTLMNVETVSESSSSTKLNCFRFYPTDSTKQLMKQYGLVTSYNDYGYALHYKLNMLRPSGDRLAAKIGTNIKLLFLIQSSNLSKLKKYKSSFPKEEIVNFFLSNKDGGGIKPDNATLSVKSFLESDDKTELKILRKNSKEKVYALQRSGDAAPFELNLKGGLSSPFAILELIIKELKETTNNINYTIKLK